MADNLVIVESPAKAKTIKKYLGRDFEVLASYGHVRDLVPKEGAVDPDNGFAMKYQVLDKNERHVESIAKNLRKAKALYLATDPDREGEAIAWHLKEILAERGDLDGKDVHRVVFYEITRNAIREAVGQPRGLSLELVNAQQARRALDYLVGFNLSPLLWKKVRRGLSAGRVQSPALRMICEREEEIAAFVAREYWTLEGEGSHSSQSFPLKLIEYRGQKVEQFSFTSEGEAREVERTLRAAAGAGSDGSGELRVIAIDRKQRRRNPAPPFTTSTLQQEAARKLGFNARRTMRLAQQLYEGQDIGEGSVGLITYMRTDSVSLAAEAVHEIREVAARLYGAAEVAEEPRVYKTKSKNAQEAHEAIRPTSAAITPADVEGKIEEDLYRLYSLIWKRAVASQMSHALFDTVAVDALAGPDGEQRHLLRANGSTLVKPGYIAVYQEGTDDMKADDADHVLPPMEVGDGVRLTALATGKPIAVRMGRFGPFVQIGTKDDEEKPRFAGLRPGQKMDSITLADAMELFKLPRTLGETPEGETIVANVGRFGPYVKYGSKYASLKEDDPYTVTLERALEVIRLKKEADANRIIQDFAEAGIQVLNGRYGPYITDKKKNAKIPKDRDPKMLTLEECRALLAAAPERGSRFGRFGRGKRPAGAPAGAEGASAAAKSRKGAAAAPTAKAEAERAHADPHAKPKPPAHAGRKRAAAKAPLRKSAPRKARAKTAGAAPARVRGLK